MPFVIMKSMMSQIHSNLGGVRVIKRYHKLAQYSFVGLHWSDNTIAVT